MIIDLYTWSTPNGRKVSIMLEETGLPYGVLPIDIYKGDQFKPSFARISPYNKIPAIVDHQESVTLIESGAILMYLAMKTGKFLSKVGTSQYWDEMQWLMFQIGNVGPMLGQCHHFAKFNPGKAPYAEERYLLETRRIYGVLEKRLAGRDFLARDYSIADIATWPWVARFEYHRVDLHDFPNVMRWYLALAERPAVQRGYKVPEDLPIPMP
ncbi:MAG: hypothetical protein RLZZ385_1221 [Pseudomonadota bacterium]|jgi:GST-like protein